MMVSEFEAFGEELEMYDDAMFDEVTPPTTTAEAGVSCHPTHIQAHLS